MSSSSVIPVQLQNSDKIQRDAKAPLTLPSWVPAPLLRGLAVEGSDIVVNRHMATNKPGCFAAGDCAGRPYQLAKAVGEGNVAAHSIAAYLAALEK